MKQVLCFSGINPEQELSLYQYHKTYVNILVQVHSPLFENQNIFSNSYF